jgi:cytochrome c553
MAKKTKTKTSDKAAPRAALKKSRAPKKRASSALSLTMPLARARKLAGDLYEAAGLAFWAEAIETAGPPRKKALVHLQDSVCEAADFLRAAKATNPKHLQLFCVACHDRDGLPTTMPRFVTAASEEEALAIWRKAFKGEYGHQRPRARPVPALAAAPELHE